ncbi:MAG: hypothetical protein HRT45_10270 [Bdellovibrionales bacterium]|nr:hypothetical protein [Bdellovibrionales bacterium]
MTELDLKQLIQQAFAGVQLERGLSLCQLEAIDSRHELSPQEFAKLAEKDVTSNWQEVDKADLKNCECYAHMDAQSFHYYLPALLLMILENYEAGEMWCIGLISSLDSRQASASQRFTVLSDTQKQAIAHAIFHLLELNNLNHEDQKVLQRSADHYWHQFKSS